MRRVLAALALAAVAAAPAATARAAADPLVWATVNVCDTAAHPDVIGIRASMPGAPRGAALRMRFGVQYRDGDTWVPVPGARSDWRRLGTGRGGSVEAGWSVRFAPRTSPVTLRGVVDLRWRRRDGRTLRRERRVTEAGHRSTAGADPASYSTATCEIRP